VSPAPSSAPSSPSADDEKLAPGRIVAAIVFAVFAVASLAAAVVYVTTPARDLPGFMGPANSGQHHALRAVGSLVTGLVLLAAAWFALRYRSLALEEAREADRAAMEAQLAGSLGSGPLVDTQPMGKANTQPMDAAQP
jgi:hypothetical protein